MTLQGALGEAVRRGDEVLSGSGSITATLAVTTPFKTIRSVSANFKRSSAPGLGSSTLTWEVSGNTVTIYAWKPTSATDTTLIAGTVSVPVSYTIIGKRR